MLSKIQHKFISSLAVKKYREEHGYYLVEGVKPVDELLLSGQEVKEIFSHPEWLDLAREKIIQKKGIRYTSVSDADLKRISQMKTPNQVLALVKIPQGSKGEINSGYYLALDKVNDPGNLGTIIRIADWFGLQGIFCSPDTADCYNPKTVQSSMGSLFRLPVMYSSLNETIKKFQALDKPVYAATLLGEPLKEVIFGGSGLIIMGSESHGISKELITLADHRITIEKRGAAESLNVAVATGIICSRLP